MNVGIVGAEAAKFTPALEAMARDVIRGLLKPGDALVSGGCHLGGIDIWAEEEARWLGLQPIIHLPDNHEWSRGYKPRNIRIAADSDVVHCLVVAELPPGYVGLRFPECYHCHLRDHVKSGGCWTALHAVRRLHKPAFRHVLAPTGVSVVAYA